MSQYDSYPFDEIIEKILIYANVEREKVKFGRGRQKYKIVCIIPGHQEKNPSLTLDRASGYFRCYGCGHKGKLAELGKLIGIDLGSGKEVEVDPDIDEFALMASKLEGLEETSSIVKTVTAPPHLRPLPPNVKWRGMPALFLTEVGGKLWYDTRSYIERIWFPCMQGGELIGWFARVRSEKDKEKFREAIRTTRKSLRAVIKSGSRDEDSINSARLEYNKAKDRLERIENMKYRNNDNQDTYKILFPLDYVVTKFKSKSVVLVEGQIDALWLNYNGIPALAILGTNNWHHVKETLLVSHGFERVILCMDNDDAGAKAQKEIYRQLRHKFKEVLKWQCPAKDPAELSPKQLARLKSIVFGDIQ